jgi:hypothetical protein
MIIVLFGISAIFPPRQYPVVWPGGWHNILFYVGIAAGKALDWPEFFLRKVWPPTPNDILRLDYLFGSLITDLVIFTVIFFVVFTIAENRKSDVVHEV